MLLSEALVLFIKEYAYLKGLDPETIRGYQIMLNVFIKVHGDKPVQDITMNDVYLLKKHYDELGLCSATIRNYIGDLKMVLKHTSKTVNLSLIPDDIPMPKFTRNLPETLTVGEIKLMINACDSLRNRLAIYLLFSTGLRIAELCNIKLKFVKDDTIILDGKGKKQRLIYLDDTAKMLLKMYLPTIHGDWLFPSTQTQGMPIQTFAMRIAIQRTAVKAGIKKRVYPHQFRHSYATNMLRNGCDIRYIQEFLGHAFITSTQIYTKVENKDLAGAYKKFHVSLS